MADPWFLAELTAVALNLGFTICIAWEKRVGWLMGLCASVIGVVLYVHKQAWAMSALNVFYAGMGVYGWWSWGRKRSENAIARKPWMFHAALFPVCLCLAAALAWAMDRWVHGAYPHLDAFITVFSFAATWMMAHRLIENWIYWIVGDVVAVYFNHLIGYDAYALLNMGYVVLSAIGLWKWSRAMRRDALSTT
jgi:nicotinamide mononucleotide transporter